MKDCLALLTSWCDALIRQQITELPDKNYYGGILCPACSLIHGRIGDAVYPFTLLYDKTRNEKYLTAAKRVLAWSEANVRRADGSYFNDKCNSWKGTTAFSAISLGETLLLHGDCLDRGTYDAWFSIFCRQIKFIHSYFVSDRFHPNINYYAAEAPAMALAYRLTGETAYAERARERAAYIKRHMTPEGLLYGENNPVDGFTARGMRYVDLGYNVEESLPALAAYAHYMQDEPMLRFAAESFAAHIEFMLPDGGWDNSWGSRANKWTYWGSRTSDGAQTGLCYLIPYGEIFAEAAQRNFRLLAECTENGLLYGGKMHIAASEEPCTHHTFCHAKALCVMIDTGFEHQKTVELPREKEYGLKKYPSVGVDLISLSEWRATVAGGDLCCYTGSAVSGGTLSLVWHNKLGMLFAAAMARYGMSEPRNMQLSRYDDEMPNIAVRVQCGEYESVNELEVQVRDQTQDAKIVISAQGTLKNIAFQSGPAYKLTYVFTKETLTVTAEAAAGGSLLLPVICGTDEPASLEHNRATVHKKGGTPTLTATKALHAPNGLETRNFNVIGGFQTLAFSLPLAAGEPETVTVCLA